MSLSSKNAFPVPGEKAFPGLWQAIGELLKLTFALIAFETLTDKLFEVVGVSSENASILSYSVSALMGYGLIIFTAIKRNKLNIKEVFPTRKLSPGFWLGLLPIIAGLSVLLSELDNLLRMIFPMSPDLIEIFRTLYGSSELNWLSAVAVIIVAPLTEETLFRGLFLNGFKRRYPHHIAIVASAFLFATMHMLPWQFIAPLALGALFAWLVLSTGSILPALIGHAFNNAIPYLMVLGGWQIPGFNAFGQLDTAVFQPAWFDLLGLGILLFGLLIWISSGVIRIKGR
ncbi:MAG: CPBP family intramembrane glutamic endopeptidase [Bacillota bacterium]|jgi:membrane protease YdiL (CAAX protease family)